MSVLSPHTLSLTLFHTHAHAHAHAHTHTHLQAATLNFSAVDQEVMNLSQAIMSADNSLVGYNQSVEAVTMLQGEIPTLRTAFMDIQENANIEDFSSTLDSIDSLELIRWALPHL